MKVIIVWIIIFVGELSGAYLIYAGFRKKRQGGPPSFRARHLFQNLPLRENSGVQLIIEGCITMFSGGLLYYAFFLW